MEKKRPTHETIQIGDIFEHTSRDECGGGCSYYQVVGKRGKTLVELRAIRSERYVDEECCYVNEAGGRGIGKVKVRPLPGQFWEKAEVFTVGVREPDEDTGRNWLRERGETSRVFGTYYSQVLEGEVGYLFGYDATYAIIDLKKEGKLPPWANELVN